MLSLERLIPAWLRARSRTRDRAASVYVSGSSVAVAKGEKTPTGFQVDLRADAIESLSQVRDLIKRQSRDVGLQDTVCSLVLAPELYALSLIAMRCPRRIAL